MHWDLFCRVVDNFGDIGVCWRLAADLAARGDTVRLWCDDASALAWMAPAGARGVEVWAWPTEADVASVEPGEVVIEAFGCHLPAGFVRRMAAGAPRPVWINLEYLSAEDYAERNHGLLSPQPGGPAQGLNKWFFYPGFTARTGGLLREPDLARRQANFHAEAWRHHHGIAPAAGERVVSLFCYANPALAALLDTLAAAPTLLLVTPGIAAQQMQALPAASNRGALRVHYLPALTQTEYDHLLWSCDLNVVRGEDSFVRAQWAGKPFLWQVYPQDDGAHVAKLAAFQRRFLSSASPDLASLLRSAAEAWNGVRRESMPAGQSPRFTLPPPGQWPDWQDHCRAWRAGLESLPNLTSALRAFVLERR